VDAVASRTFHLSTNAPSRNDFVNAVRNNPSAKAQLKEVISQLFHQEFNMLRLTFCWQIASRLPPTYVNEYSVDVLRQKGMAGFDTQDRVPDHFSWSGQQSSIFAG
jgi:hypothetical protein